ncbi:hypothetical protein L3X38_023003 [Prunus dulcis]|uniref:Integrase catalytic domain-containing protein n=2 Tax=Prunus dulcis TaxID=3755 RepID=A0AAD4Z549_PRUDU|nr:hypothetical protein L3X38_023003 [Prunus dulcis]
MIWLISTLSEDLLSHIVGIESAQDLLNLLERRFSGVSRANIHQLRSRLQSISKGDLSMDSYLQSVKEIADGLAADGQSLSESDLVAYVLNGLPDEYDSFITSIETRIEPVTLDELHALLLGRESAILKRKTRSTSVVATEPFHAYAATSGSSRSNFRGGRGRGRFHSNSGSQFHSRNHPFPGTNNSSGRGLLPTPSSFFPTNTSSTNSNGFFYNSSGFSPDRSMTCQICERKGHFSLTCRQRLNLSYNANVVPARFQAPSAHYAHSASPPTDNLWLADSGASNHVTSNMSNLGHSSPYTGSETLRVGDGNSLPISHTGSTILHTSNAKFHLLNVLHVPQVAHNLLSVHKFVSDNHCSLIFDEIGVSIKDNATQRMLYQGPCDQGLYPIYCSSSVQVSPLSSGTSPTAFLVSKASIHTWHKRLGHPHSAVLKTIVTSNQLPLEDSSFSKPQCTDCILGKATRLPFTPSSSVSTTPLELVHSDVWGPSPIDSCTGYRYYVLFLDDYTKYSWIFPLKFKSDVCEVFKVFKAKMENVLNSKIKYLRSDSGGEYLSTGFQTFLNQQGIIHQFSCPHTPQQNGSAERKHRHIVELARTFLAASGVPHKYWVDAFLTATYVINRLPHTTSHMSPWQLLFNTLLS